MKKWLLGFLLATAAAAGQQKPAPPAPQSAPAAPAPPKAAPKPAAITRQRLKAQVATLQAAREKLLINLHQIDGALDQCQMFLEELEPEALAAKAEKRTEH